MIPNSKIAAAATALLTGMVLVLAGAAAQTAAAQSGATQTAAAQSAKPAEAPRIIFYKIAAGDLDGDSRAELVTWNDQSKRLVVSRLEGGAFRDIASHEIADFPNAIVVADLDADGKAELVVGQGLRGYNPKEGPQTDARVNVYRPLSPGGWEPVEVFRKVTERPDVTSLKVVDLDGDKQPEILFALFVEKYFVDVMAARRSAEGWTVEKILNVRMGPHVAAGDVFGEGRPRIVVGRPYGDALGVLGDAFVAGENGKRLALPFFRGVSSLAVGDADGDGRLEIAAGDGWHQDYGKLARGRVAVAWREAGSWRYELVEDVPKQTRIRGIEFIDIDGSGGQEILAWGEMRNSLGGDVRLYERRDGGWRGATLATDVQGHAVADFEGNGRLQIVFAGPDPKPQPLDLASVKWDAELAPEVRTYEVDHTKLVGRPAPRLQAGEWIGSDALSLDALTGRVVLLDFWATWCKPCIDQFPTLRRWKARFGDDLVIVGVTNLSSQTAETVREFVETHEIDWPVAIDADDRTQMDYGVSPIPHTFVIDREGIIRLSHVGGGKLDEIERMLESLAEKTGRPQGQ